MDLHRFRGPGVVLATLFAGTFVMGSAELVVVGILDLVSADLRTSISTAGLLVNLILFVVLGMPSSGGTIPLEAIPKSFAWLSWFEPMHQVFLGIRSILYFNADGSSVGEILRSVAEAHPETDEQDDKREKGAQLLGAEA